MFPTLSTLSRNRISAQLPDITGYIIVRSGADYPVGQGGCFSYSRTADTGNPVNVRTNAQDKGVIGYFRASSSNPVYSSSGKVTPTSCTCRILIKY